MVPARVLTLVVCCASILASGCNTLTHPAAKEQAHRHWSQVRGRVKFQLAQQQYEARLFAEAIRTVTEALSLDPLQVDGYVLLARANLELSRLGSAKEAVDTAARLGLESPDLIYTEGVILEQQDRVQEALARYSEAQALDPSNVDYLVAAAEGLVATGRAEEALALLDENTNRLDDEGTIGVLAAQVAWLLGDRDGASRHLSEAVVPAASRDSVAEDLGIVLARSNRCEEALSVLEPLADSAAEPIRSGAMYRSLAKCLLALGDPQRAKDVLDDYAREHPEDTAAQLLWAKAAVATDDMLIALRALDAAERNEPRSLEVKFVRATLQWRRGEFFEAVDSLEEILADNPRDIEAHCLLGEVYLALDRPEAGYQHFSRALKLDPKCAWAADALRSLG